VRRIPDARLVVIPGAGHKLPIEQPEALTEAIVRFLGEVAA
jgi:pimeloyl-ACP methyl ester carboxylesterase